MKLEPVAKLHKANTATSRKGNDVMLANCSITVIFPVYCQFGAMRKPYSGRMICITYILINSNFLPYKN